MTQLEEVLKPLSDELLYVPRQYADLNGQIRMEILDGQDVLQSGVLYIGTSKMVAALLKSLPKVEPGCFVVATNVSRPMLLNTPLQKQATCIEIRESLSRVFNHFSTRLHELQLANNQARGSFEQFLDDVLSRRKSSEASIRESIAAFCPDMKAFYRVVLVRIDPDYEQDAEELRLALQRLMPGLNIHHYHHELAGMYYHEDRQLSLPVEDAVREQLRQTLEEYHAELAVTNGTRHYDMIRTLHMQASRIMTLGHALHLQDVDRIYEYERFSMYNVIDLAAQRFVEVYGHTDVIYLIHPAVVLLTRYDQTHSSTLRDTLYYYLLHDRNLVRTARAVYMHRNTVVNKINKIVELTGADLTDGGLCQRLIFSCQLIQYYERVMGMTLKL